MMLAVFGLRGFVFVIYSPSTRSVTDGREIFCHVWDVKAADISLLLPDGAWLRLFTAALPGCSAGVHF